MCLLRFLRSAYRFRFPRSGYQIRFLLSGRRLRFLRPWYHPRHFHWSYHFRLLPWMSHSGHSYIPSPVHSSHRLRLFPHNVWCSLSDTLHPTLFHLQTLHFRYSTSLHHLPWHSSLSPYHRLSYSGIQGHIRFCTVPHPLLWSLPRI